MMETVLCAYHPDTGWDKAFPDMDAENTMVLVFGGTLYAQMPEPFSQLKAAFPKARIAGCSTAGEILGERVYDDHLVVSITRFAHTQLAVQVVPIQQMEDSFTAGVSLSQALQKEGLASMLVLSDGLNVNGTDLVRGINQELATGVVVTGGLAGDGTDFSKTWVLKEGMPVEKHISAIAFYGDKLQLGHGSKGGWEAFGPKRTITRSKHNVLYELDGEPALPLYKDYLGDLAVGLPSTGLRFPLVVNKPGEDSYLVRTILAIDEATQSMTFAGDMTEGYRAQLMSASFDQLVDGAESAALMTKENGGEKVPGLVVAISCVGRRIVLGEEIEAETESIQAVFAAPVPQIGFYSYGELSPYATGNCELHNQTMTLTTFYEAD